MAESDVPKKAFKTQYSPFEWGVVPFGLAKTPLVFIMLMNYSFSNLLEQGVVIFLENIFIYSNNVATHFQLLRNILDRLQQFQFYCKLKKCLFLKQKISFLRFDITSDVVRV